MLSTFLKPFQQFFSQPPSLLSLSHHPSLSSIYPHFFFLFHFTNSQFSNFSFLSFSSLHLTFLFISIFLYSFKHFFPSFFICIFYNLTFIHPQKEINYFLNITSFCDISLPSFFYHFPHTLLTRLYLILRFPVSRPSPPSPRAFRRASASPGNRQPAPMSRLLC